MAFMLALLKTRLDLFHAGKRDGTWENQEGKPLHFAPLMKFITNPHPTIQVSRNSFPHYITRTNFHLNSNASLDPLLTIKVPCAAWDVGFPQETRVCFASAPPKPSINPIHLI